VILDESNLFTWDITAIPSGSYFVYEVTEDPPLLPVYGISHAPITIQHEGDPLWPAVQVLEPDGVSDIASEAYPVRWRASGGGPLVATVSWGQPVTSTEPLTEIAADVPMLDAGGGVYEGCLLWDLSALPQGYYFVNVEVRDPAGLTHAAFSRNSLVIFRPSSGGIDAGTPPSCETPVEPDAGPGAIDAGQPIDGPGPDCACAVGPAGSRGGAPWLSLLLVALAAAAALGRTARRRTPARG
jgi:hypothetical protein